MMTEERIHMLAHSLIENWMSDYKVYLLDGDPRILHPRAKAALVLAFTEAMNVVQMPIVSEETHPKARKPRKRLADGTVTTG